MRSRQRGATLLGILTIVAIIGCALYGGVRLFPIYMENMAINRALKQTAQESTGAGIEQLRTGLARRWAVEDIKTIDYKEIEIKRAGQEFTLRAWYRAEVPFVANISLVADFDKTFTTGSGKASP